MVNGKLRRRASCPACRVLFSFVILMLLRARGRPIPLNHIRAHGGHPGAHTSQAHKMLLGAASPQELHLLQSTERHGMFNAAVIAAGVRPHFCSQTRWFSCQVDRFSAGTGPA